MSDHPFVDLMDRTFDFMGALLLAGLVVLVVFTVLVVALLRWGGVEYPAGQAFLGSAAVSVTTIAILFVLARSEGRSRKAGAVAQYLTPICMLSTAIAGFSGLAWIVLRILP